jgi:predicted RNA binding protein YcfA (HicA-like mRNA interferase family)
MLQVPELPVISGQKAIKTLVKLGFVVVRQKGNHVFLQRENDTVTVPLHNPLKKGKAFSDRPLSLTNFWDF